MPNPRIRSVFDRFGILPTPQRLDIASILLERPQHLSADPVRKFYDSTTHPHHHFYNVDTGELSDIPDAKVSFEDFPDIPFGTERESVEVLIKVRNRTE